MPNDTESKTDSKARTPAPRLRKPDATDGADIWALIQDCKPLDENSMYCNLVQADHFRDTCVLAEVDGDILGWVSGHMIPDQDALFVWQVAVSPRARGMGLGRKMLFELLERDAASWALFRSFARQLGGTLSDAPHFERETHFDGHHDTEHMVTITLPRSQLARAA